ncbi:hypothetical protein HK405_006245 [Cladochytrium tenue]|nr:hypothetical protein HK405_006245 [Cladochytrium tenue]
MFHRRAAPEPPATASTVATATAPANTVPGSATRSHDDDALPRVPSPPRLATLLLLPPLVDALDFVSLRELLRTSRAVRAAARSSAAPFRYAAAVRKALHLAAADIISCADAASAAAALCRAVRSPPSAIATDGDASVPAFATATTGTLHPHLPLQPSEPPPSILPLPLQLQLEQLRNLAENACTGYLDTAEMWVLAEERADAALRKLQNAAASASSSSSSSDFAAPQTDAPDDVDDNDNEQGSARFALAAAVLAQACEIELVSNSVLAYSRHVLRRFRLWVRVDHGHARAIPACADNTEAPLTLELREDFANGFITRSWAVLVTSAVPDAVPCDAAAAATLSALVKKTIGPADAEQSAQGVKRWTILCELEHGTNGHTLPIGANHQRQMLLQRFQLARVLDASASSDTTNRLSGLAALLNCILPASRTFPTLSPAPARAAATSSSSSSSSFPATTAVATEPTSIDRWTPALANAAVRALLDWPLPRATSADLPVSPSLHAAIMCRPLLRDALRAFAVVPDAQESPAPSRGLARHDLSRFWIAAVVSVVKEAVVSVVEEVLEIVTQRI